MPARVLGRDATRLVPGSRTWLVRLRAGVTPASLGRRPGVVAVEPDRPRTVLAGPDPLLGQQTYLRQIRWTRPTGRRRPLVAVLDTGVDGRVRDLRGRIDVARSRSFIDDLPLTDSSGHGTHVAGTIAAVVGNGVGTAGVANARLLIVKIADAQGRATTSTLVRGIRYAVANRARVINVSFGGSGFSRLEQDAILSASRAGALVVAAAGNSGRAGSPREFPGAYRHVLTVAAVRPDGDAILDSTRGPQVALSAPGKRILSTAPRGRYARRTGTSMATGLVSGAAARLLAQRPGLAASQLRSILIGSARDAAEPGWDEATGWGVLDLTAALDAPTPPPDGVEPNDDPAQALRTAELLPGTAPAEASAEAEVERWADPKDDYRVPINAGDVLELDAQGGGGVDLDLVVWRPGAPAFTPGAAYARRWLAAASLAPGGSEALRFTATESGVHTVEVQAAAGRGRYRLIVRRVSGPPPL